eukprot:CAMPEP_0180115478 /NCGR_PEP_ID=MMETSP0985-20121206/37872_1 /TAXON_ID=483367 /ORGANISM="non described non described, Strain CCMP 2436" /LENGTH=211 /DNA_ID=CAMNT_0022054121 /DNA_START=58 /DNA_END=693 /DNA_ORIENTATION=-
MTTSGGDGDLDPSEVAPASPLFFGRGLLRSLDARFLTLFAPGFKKDQLAAAVPGQLEGLSMRPVVPLGLVVGVECPEGTSPVSEIADAGTGLRRGGARFSAVLLLEVVLTHDQERPVLDPSSGRSCSSSKSTSAMAAPSSGPRFPLPPRAWLFLLIIPRHAGRSGVSPLLALILRMAMFDFTCKRARTPRIARLNSSRSPALASITAINRS